MATKPLRSLVGFILAVFLLAQPAYAIPVTVIDPTKRAFTYLPAAPTLGLTSAAQAGDPNLALTAHELLI